MDQKMRTLDNIHVGMPCYEIFNAISHSLFPGSKWCYETLEIPSEVYDVMFCKGLGNIFITLLRGNF